MSLTPVTPEAAVTQRPYAQTLSEALRKLQQNERIDVAQYVEQDALDKGDAEALRHPAALPLKTPVRLASGVYGVITGQNPNERNRYRVSWFSRHFWAVRHTWLDRTQFEVVNG